MGNTKDSIKKWAIEQVTEHIKRSITYFLTLIGLAGVWMALKTWLTTEHNLNLAGWLWVLIFFVTAALPLLIFLTIAAICKKQDNTHLLTDKTDCIVALSDWLRIQANSHSEITIRYNQIDRACDLSSGTSKKLLSIFNGDTNSDGTKVNITVAGKETVKILLTGNKRW